MKLTATISVPKDIHDIIKPEMMSKERSSMTLEVHDDRCDVHIDAKDVTAFKTSLHSIMKYLDVIDKVGRADNGKRNPRKNSTTPID